MDRPRPHSPRRRSRPAREKPGSSSCPRCRSGSLRPARTSTWLDRRPTGTRSRRTPGLLNAYGPTESSDDVTHYERIRPEPGSSPPGAPAARPAARTPNRQYLHPRARPFSAACRPRGGRRALRRRARRGAAISACRHARRRFSCRMIRAGTPRWYACIRVARAAPCFLGHPACGDVFPPWSWRPLRGRRACPTRTCASAALLRAGRSSSSCT